MLQRNKNKSVCTTLVRSDEHTRADSMLLQIKNYRTGRKELEQGTTTTTFIYTILAGEKKGGKRDIENKIVEGL